MNGRMSVLDCQVWVQDVALELTRLDRRLAKIDPSVLSVGLEPTPVETEPPVESEIPVRIRRLRRRYLQPATLLLLDLAQKAGQENLQRDQEWDELDNLQGELP